MTGQGVDTAAISRKLLRCICKLKQGLYAKHLKLMEKYRGVRKVMRII